MYPSFTPHPTNIGDRSAWKTVNIGNSSHIIFTPLCGSDTSRLVIAANFALSLVESFKISLSETEPVDKMSDFTTIHESCYCLPDGAALPPPNDEYYVMFYLGLMRLHELNHPQLWLAKDFDVTRATFYYFYTEKGSSYPPVGKNRIFKMTINRYKGSVITEGKQNRTVQEQIVLEAISSLRTASAGKTVQGSSAVTQEDKKFHTPMSADDLTSCVAGQTLKLSDVYGWFSANDYPKMVQEKIDGMRATAYMNGDEVTVISKTQHLIPKAIHYFGNEIKRILSFLPPGSVLDGELWAQGYTSSKISGFFRAMEKNKTEIHVEIEKNIYYRVFGFYCGGNQENLLAFDRYTMLERAFASSGASTSGFRTILVPMAMVHTPEDLFSIIQQIEAQELEGIIIYSNCIYKHTRGSHILKYKISNEVDLPLVGITSALGHEEGQAIFVFEHLGKYFQVRPAMTKEERIELLRRPPPAGQIFKIKYYGFTEDGNFRHPTMAADTA
jgi:hypothetical protein